MENDILKLIPITVEMIDALLDSDKAFLDKIGYINEGEEFLTPSKEYLIKIRSRMISHPEEIPLAVDHLIILKEIKTVIGSIYFKYLPKEGVSEIGYGMNSKYECHGYMTMAVDMMIKYGGENGINTILADTDINNLKSQNVLLRNGFKKKSSDDRYIYFIKDNA